MVNRCFTAEINVRISGLWVWGRVVWSVNVTRFVKGVDECRMLLTIVNMDAIRCIRRTIHDPHPPHLSSPFMDIVQTYFRLLENHPSDPQVDRSVHITFQVPSRHLNHGCWLSYFQVLILIPLSLSVFSLLFVLFKNDCAVFKSKSLSTFTNSNKNN